MEGDTIDTFLIEVAKQVALWGAMEHERGVVDGYEDCNEVYQFDLILVNTQAQEQLPAILEHIKRIYYDAHGNSAALAEGEDGSNPGTQGVVA